MSTNSPNPQPKLSPSNGYLIYGSPLDNNTFIGRVVGAQLLKLASDPMETERTDANASPALQDLRRIREEVQRLFSGAKKDNVEPYSNYIVAMANGEFGVTPPIVLWSQEAFAHEVDDNGNGTLLIPWSARVVAIDGETQLAARHLAEKKDPKTTSQHVAIVICHGRPTEWARQAFHDLNVLAITPNAALALGMDQRDPLTSVAREVEDKVPFFRNRVNKVRRQLGGKDDEVVTITALRGACVTLALGMVGVKFGAKPVTVASERLPAIRRAAVEWFTAVTELLGPAIESRDKNLAGAPPVLAAIGAMGHDLVEIDDSAKRQQKLRELRDQLRGVRWEKGELWDGIAGKINANGHFSGGGSKETAYAIYAALSDRTSPAYERVRGAVTVGA